MKVDFDSLRKQLAYSYNKLYKQYEELKTGEKSVNELEYFEDTLNDLHIYIGLLLACSSSGNDVFESIDIELEPKDE